MESLDQFRQTFFDECRELLDTTESYLAQLSDGAFDQDTMHAIFRAIHSIKGGAGAFGLTRLVDFAHKLEGLLDGMRNGEIAVTPAAAELLTRAVDALADIVREAETGEPISAGIEAALIVAIDGFRPAAGASGAPLLVASAAEERVTRHYRIRFEPNRDLIKNANEPVYLLRELARMGGARIVAHLDAVPDLDDFDPEEVYLSWTVDLSTNHPKAAISDVFEFVSDDCQLDIDEIEREAATAAVAALPPPEAAATRAPGDANPSHHRRPASNSIRVDTDKVDRLVNLVGELVTTQAMLAQATSHFEPGTHLGVLFALDTMLQHIRELQDNVMAIRAQPVRSVFARLPKLVRDIGASLGKSVRLVMTGEQTEIDKTVVEQLGDPLTHMIRNAIDHGIEIPEEREKAGKSPIGTIHVGAEHRSGRIVITITDDGRGIDRARLLAKARDRGLVSGDATPSDEEIDALVFMPGLSTAAKLSDISGRGVGMDVVKRNIEALGGRVSIQSHPGAGCRFTLSLPLTLAVMDGMTVSVGREVFVIPITAILESLRPAPEAVHDVAHSGEVLAIRGDYVPLLYLHRLFGIPNAVGHASQGLVVLVDSDDGKLGIVVDDLQNLQQVVIKSLEENYGRVPGIAAATILGNGRVALILDVAGLSAVAGAVSRIDVPPTARPALSAEMLR